MCDLSAPQFKDEKKAREYLENLRWADGVACPHCGVIGKHYELKGEAHRDGVWKCYECREQFSVTVGTVFERSHVPLTKWLMAVHLMCASKKGVSAHQLHRMLGVTYKTAWFMAHRVREAMRSEHGVFGKGGGTVEADETYIGRKPGMNKRPGAGHKGMVFNLVERKGGARSIHITGKMFDELKAALLSKVARDAALMTDDSRLYWKIGKEFADHQSVNHSIGEYVRGNAHTNTIEGYFSVFKRGMKGVYQHCSSAHLQRYLDEFDFRYSNRTALGVNDKARTDAALRGIAGKRLTYKGPCEAH